MTTRRRPSARPPVPLPGTDLASFLATAPTLDPGQQAIVVEQAIVLLSELYVHLLQKRARYAIDPVQRLRLLRQRLGELSAREVHDELISTFASLHDRHTGYLAPQPFRDKVATLPFLVEHHRDGYVVSKVTEWADVDATFVPGVVLTHWNGVPFSRAVDVNAGRQRGANPDARRARGLQAMTVRPLAFSLPPDEDWVDARYLDKRGRPHEQRFTWRVLDVADPLIGDLPNATSLAVDPSGEASQQAKRDLFAPKSAAASPWDESALPRFLSARTVSTKHGPKGYLRIWSFTFPDDDRFVAEAIRLMTSLPSDGLIVDVRGNPGGYVACAERLLQTLTANRIEPARFSLTNSATTLALCAADRANLGAWAASIAAAVGTGEPYSQGLTLTSARRANDVGQHYFGPVVLIVDALSYSSADIFAAGFQDNGIGAVLGTSGATGAGGANVWTYDQIRALLDDGGTAWPPLPLGASFSLALRRATRVGEREGLPLEDIGVIPDELHALSARDVLEGNGDLLDRAADLMARWGHEVTP